MSNPPTFSTGNTPPVSQPQSTILQGEQSSDSRVTVATTTLVPQTHDSAQTNYNNCGVDVKTFKQLQTIVVPIVNGWASTIQARSHPFHQIWLTAWKGSIYSSTTFTVVKRQLRIKNLKQYHDIILQCPAIVQTLDTVYDSIAQRIHYRQKQVTATVSVTTMSEPIISDQTTASPTPNNIKPEVIISDNPTSLPMRQTSQETANEDVVTELLLDIEEEDAAEPGHRFKNRFIHRFLDTYNAKMGDFGNYIKTTQQLITERVNGIEGSLNSFDSQLTDFDQKYQRALAKAHKEVQEMDAKLPYFNTTLDQRINNALSRVSQQVTHYQLQLTKWTKEQSENSRMKYKPTLCRPYKPLLTIT